jgi:hypothetical protein
MSDLPMMDNFNEEDLTDEEIQQLVALGIIPEQMDENARQMQMSEQLRYQAAPEGRDSGRVYTAANPMEHIGSVMEKYNAQKQIGKLGEERSGMLNQQARDRKLYYELLRGKRKSKLQSVGADGIQVGAQDFSGVAMPKY